MEDKISKHEIGLLAIRILAIFLIANSITSLVMSSYSVIVSISSPGNFLPILSMTLLSFLPYFVIGTYLWFNAGTISQRIFQDSDPLNKNRSLSYRDISTAAIALLGLWVLTDSLPNLLKTLTYRYILIDEYIQGMNSMQIIDLKANYAADLVKSTAKSIFGFWLILGNSFFIELFIKVRTFGKED